MLILGIESSCDETAASLVEIKKNKIKIISNVVSSQIKIHQKYGGVVPEIAGRAHLENILPVIAKALKNYVKNIDLIAVTIGPGLITSLLVGIETAKSLAYIWNKPIIGINHLEGHIYANWLPISKCQMSNVKSLPRVKSRGQMFPAICLIVSGGHTELILMKDYLKYKKIGQTRDDAAGEAFDKTARLLNLGYPGGPIIAAEAAKFPISNFQFPNKSKIQPGHPTGLPDRMMGQNSKLVVSLSNPFKICLPRPMINSGDYNFSFSGLKTAVFYQLKKDKNWKKKISEYCYEFQQAVIDVLISKTLKVVKEYKVKTIMLTGGVAANDELRKQFESNVKCQMSNVNFLVPPKNFCTDNATMIAVAGYFNIIKKMDIKNIKGECHFLGDRNGTPLQQQWQKLKPNPNLEL